MAHRRSRFLFLLFLWFPAVALAQPAGQPVYRLQNSPGLTVTEPGSWKAIHKGAEFRKLTLQRSEPHQMIDLKMVRFDTRWLIPRILRSLQLKLKAANVKTLAEKSGAMAAINANYFDEKDRSPFIIHKDHFSPEIADEGLQAGPLLLAKGIALPVTRGAGKQSRGALIGIDKEQRLTIAVTDSLFGGLTWVELQEIFGAGQWQVQTVDLLNLDGGGSAQLYVKGAQLEEHVPGTTEVPVAIGFFQK